MFVIVETRMVNDISNHSSKFAINFKPICTFIVVELLICEFDKTIVSQYLQVGVTQRGCIYQSVPGNWLAVD